MACQHSRPHRAARTDETRTESVFHLAPSAGHLARPYRDLAPLYDDGVLSATRSLVAGLLVAGSLSACGPSGLLSPLPTSACLSVPIAIGIIHGDPALPDRIVLTTKHGETLTLVDVADAYEFVFDPDLRVVHVDGQEAARENDEVDIGGMKQDGPDEPGVIGWCGEITRLRRAQDSPTPTAIRHRSRLHFRPPRAIGPHPTEPRWATRMRSGTGRSPTAPTRLPTPTWPTPSPTPT